MHGHTTKTFLNPRILIRKIESYSHNPIWCTALEYISILFLLLQLIHRIRHFSLFSTRCFLLFMLLFLFTMTIIIFIFFRLLIPILAILFTTTFSIIYIFFIAINHHSLSNFTAIFIDIHSLFFKLLLILQFLSLLIQLLVSFLLTFTRLK